MHDGTHRKVRYEDLCRDTVLECESIFAFLGLEASRATLSMEDTAHHVLGNAMRLDSLNAVKLDESWKNELDEASLRVFESVAGLQNRRYGYE